MAVEKVVVSLDEIDRTVVEDHSANAPAAALKPLPPAIPLWSKIALSVLALVLPLLCIVTIILRWRSEASLRETATR